MVSNPFSEGLSVKVSGDTEGATSALANLQGSLKSAKFAVAGLGAALAAAAAGGLAKAAQQANSFDEAIIELSKRVGKDQAEEMRDGISEMAEEIPLSREEITGLADDAARFGIEGEESILKFTETVAKMGEATTLSVDEAGKSMAKLATLTKTPVSEVENLGSAINSLSNNFATSSQEIVDSMLRSSAALSQLGLNQKEIAGLSASINEVSESSRRAGTRLRRVAQEMMDPGKVGDVASALGMTTEEFKEMRRESPRKALMQLVEAMAEGGEKADLIRSTFSTASRQAIAGLSQNLDATREALQMSNKEFEQATSLQREFDREMAKASAQIDVVVSKLNGIAIQIGKNVLPIFRKFLSNVVTPAIERFAKLNDKTDGMAGTLGLAGTAITGIGVALAALVGGPITLAIGAIAGLSAAWAKNVGGIQQKTQTAFNAIKNIIQTVLTPVINALTGVWNDHGTEIRQEIDETFTHIQSVIQDAIEFIKPFVDEGLQFLQDMWAEFGDEIMLVVDFAFATVLGTLKTVFDGLLTLFEVVLNLIQGDWEEAFGVMVNFLVDTFNGLLEFGAKWGSKFLDAIVENLPDAIQGTVKEALGIGTGGVSIQAPQIESPIEQVPSRQQRDQVVVESENRIRFEGGDEITQILADEANRKVAERERRDNRQSGRRPNING